MMNHAMLSDGPAAAATVAVRGSAFVTQTAVATIARHGPSCNDAAYDAGGDTALHARPASYDLYPGARAHRSRAARALIAAAIRRVRAVARLTLLHHRLRQRASAIRDMLRQLDDRSLHDLGFDRSEIGSVAAEATGAAEPSRVRTILASYGAPR
jgi:uncharacterized protein YjiS (DUF1127 family)